MDCFKSAALAVIAAFTVLFSGCTAADSIADDHMNAEHELPLLHGDPVTVTVSSPSPDPEDFVTAVTGIGDVSVRFAKEYNFTYPHDLDVTVIITDETDRSFKVTSQARCVVPDTSAPTLECDGDIYVNIGEAVSYKSDVTVTDNADNVELSVDNSLVDLSREGAYKVTYTAADSAGNTSELTRTVYVTEELPPSEEAVMATAQRIYDEEIHVSDDMSQWDIAYGIYNWCCHTIKFDLAGTDRSRGPLKLAYEGFTELRGDCYTYMITSKYLFDVAGIDTIEVTRMRYEGESEHFWLLVDIGDGWYHFDSTCRSTGKGTDTFMLTDAEVAAFCEKFEVPYYYRFDHDAYPARSERSYFTD